MTETFDAIVVGGGLAGLIAARELQHRGLRTVILEGRSRLGGRAWTEQFRGVPIEMGGQNVYWGEPFIWSEITRYALPIAEVIPFETYAIVEGDGLKRYPSLEAGRQLGAGFDAFFGNYASAIPRPFDPDFDHARLVEIDRLSIQDRLDQIDVAPDALRWLKPWLGMRTGGSLDVGAFTWLLHIYALADQRWPKMLEMSSRFRLAGGMKTLLDAIFTDSGAELRLDSPVNEIADEGDRVHVTTLAGETFAASVGVVATSANLWSHIDFSAGLSTAKRESSKAGMQTPVSFIKLWALVRGDVENVYIQRPNFKEHPIIHLRKDMQRPDGLTQVIAFSVDPTLDTNDHARIARLFQETLPLPNAEVVDITAHNWVADPFTLGGTSLLRPGQLSMLSQIRQPEGRLTFATADIATATPGYDGAIQTGIMAAANAIWIARENRPTHAGSSAGTNGSLIREYAR